MSHAPEPPANTRPVRDAHRFDEAALRAWLAPRLPGGMDEALEVRQFKGGQSNPTYWLAAGARQLVLRKKPPGDLLPSAHAVDREYRVITALQGTDVPVATTLACCDDPAVIGTAFYVMEYVSGRIFWNAQLPDLAPAERAALYAELVRVLAALHTVDYRARGLADFGREGGYVARQVKRWSGQYEASRTDPVPAMEALMAYLPAHVPAADETALIHGDYRLDNLIFAPDAPRALAVIDWELSTLGHPLSDLAYHCMLYHVALPRMGGLAGVDFATTGLPSEADFVGRYCALTGRAEVRDWAYYKAFSLFRLAAIAQGVFKRSLQGNASSEDAGMFGAAVGLLADVACGLLAIPVGP